MVYSWLRSMLLRSSHFWATWVVASTGRLAAISATVKRPLVVWSISVPSGGMVSSSLPISSPRAS